jgi:hypothetical protein
MNCVSMKKNFLDTITASMGIALSIILGAYSAIVLFAGHVSFKGFWPWQPRGTWFPPRGSGPHLADQAYIEMFSAFAGIVLIALTWSTSSQDC